MRTSIPTIGLAVLLSLAGCAKPVPKEKEAFLGEWKAPSMHLLMLRDGHVKYERVDNGKTTEIDGPLQGFDGDNFKVGLWFMATTFVVQQPPHEVDGTLRMTVDGVELIRAGDGDAATAEQKT
jgi:hypothetical protein